MPIKIWVDFTNLECTVKQLSRVQTHYEFLDYLISRSPTLPISDSLINNVILSKDSFRSYCCRPTILLRET